MSKITCKECKQTCCDNVEIKPHNKRRKNLVDTSTLKVGDWIYISGITLVKKKNGLFRCRAFDPRTRLCRVWRYRPPLCRDFFCPWTSERKRKMPVGKRDRTYYLYFKTCLRELVKGTVPPKSKK